jgi:DNA mismatch endonuclease (patch repair protein)
MRAVKSENTAPEMVVRRVLHKKGYRYRLHVRKLPGSPDLVLKRHRAVIFVHGCFWHRHNGCKLASLPKSRETFWVDKFNRNIERDARNVSKLKELKLRVAIVWECQLRRELRETTLVSLIEWLPTSSSRFELGLDPA